MIGTVGYHLLGNHSIGPVLYPRLKSLEKETGLWVEEMNWGPIAIVQYFQSLEQPFDRVVFLGAVERTGRQIGDITVFKWEGSLPPEKQIQACIGDAATGVISIENLLVIGEFFNIWPKDVYLIDVEPGPEVAGEEFTPAMQEHISVVLQTVKRIALEGPAPADNEQPLYGASLFEPS